MNLGGGKFQETTNRVSCTLINLKLKSLEVSNESFTFGMKSEISTREWKHMNIGGGNFQETIFRVSGF